MIQLPTYNQWGESWSGKKMLPSQVTLATHGCYITSVAMALANYAITFDPGQTLDKLIAVNGLISDGQLTYDGLTRAFPKVSFYERGYTTNDLSGNFVRTGIETAVKKIRRLVTLGNPVLLAVDNLGNDNLPDHAVVLYDAPSDISKWRIKDPDGGKDILFKDKYGDAMKKIYGWVALLGQPVSFPDDGDPKAGSACWRLAEIKREINVQLNAREALDVFLGG